MGHRAEQKAAERKAWTLDIARQLVHEALALRAARTEYREAVAGLMGVDPADLLDWEPEELEAYQDLATAYVAELRKQ